MILMQSGEWLVYKSHCNKRPPHYVSDIFLAKGSNGKWFYSTYHFCVGMLVLRMDQDIQPPSLDYFVTEYDLREFDGKSDECLKATRAWPASWLKAEQTNQPSQKTASPDEVSRER